MNSLNDLLKTKSRKDVTRLIFEIFEQRQNVKAILETLDTILKSLLQIILHDFDQDEYPKISVLEIYAKNNFDN